MPSPELNEWIDQLIKQTDEGVIGWRLANPTTYLWDTPSPRAGKVQLQRVERMEGLSDATGRVVQRKVTSYIMQVFDLRKSVQQPTLSLNGIEDAEANTIY